LDIKKFNRRADSVRCAYGLRQHASTTRRALRVTDLIVALENWLDRNVPGDPMTLGNMRENGVRSLALSCWQCHHGRSGKGSGKG
jgi:hypothetical protein